jgi:hypothetical protein
MKMKMWIMRRIRKNRRRSCCSRGRMRRRLRDRGKG